MKTLSQHLDEGKKLLPESNLDIDLLLCHALKTPRIYLYTHADELITEEKSQTFNHLLQQRIQGKPLAYILGQQAFWKNDFIVTPDVLIPRPETELLVETTLELLDKNYPQKILELGVGSGAVSISIAKERSSWEITATDISDAALKIATKNSQYLSVENLMLAKSNWFENIPPQKFSAIISNPPYVSATEFAQSLSIQNEPKQALIAEENGLKDLRIIIENSIHYLENNGWLLLEHGYQQKISVTKLLENAGYKNIQTRKDFSGHDRITFANMTQ